MVTTATSGPPVFFDIDVDETTGTDFRFGGPIFFIDLYNSGANPVKIYRTEADRDAGTNGFTVASGAYLPSRMKVKQLWFKAVTGPSSIEGIGYLEL